jgi:hypothetical protein
VNMVVLRWPWAAILDVPPWYDRRVARGS